MRIKQHDRSHLVELRDGSAWRIWPGDTPKTLQWLSTTEIDVADIEDEICSHALINRSDGSRVRVIKPQSFVSKYEGDERRLDVVEFLEVAAAPDADPVGLLRALTRKTA